MLLATPIHLAPLLRSPRNLTVIAFAIGAIAGATSYLLTRKRLTDAEREQLRRDHLAHIGRITDGSITETQWIVPNSPVSDLTSVPTASIDPAVADPAPPFTTPAILLYRYRIAGVTYECAQDVTLLPDYVRQVRVDLPVQGPLRPPQPRQQHRRRRIMEWPPHKRIPTTRRSRLIPIPATPTIRLSIPPRIKPQHQSTPCKRLK